MLMLLSVELAFAHLPFQASIVLFRFWQLRPPALHRCWWADSPAQKHQMSTQLNLKPRGQRWRRRAGPSLLSIRSHLPSSPSSSPWHRKPTTLGSEPRRLSEGFQRTAFLLSSNCFTFYTRFVWLLPIRPKLYKHPLFPRQGIQWKKITLVKQSDPST